VKTLRTDSDLLAPSFVALWSSGYVVGSVATRSIAPLTVTLWRFVISAVVLAGIALYRHETWPVRPRDVGFVAVTGVVAFTVQFTALYRGLADGMPAATTALIACSAPLVVAVAGAALGWDRLSGRQWLGVLLGVAGVVVTLSDRLGRPPSAGALAWTVIGLGGLAGGSLLQGRLLGRGGPTALTAVQVAAGAVATAFWAPFAGSLRIPVTTSALTSFGWLALVAGVVGPLLLLALIQRHGPTRGTSLLFLVPSVTAFFGWALLREPVGVVALLGLAIAGLGLWLGRRTPAPVTHPVREPVGAGVRPTSEPELCGCTK
jgi:drug/metabolite transporter (DMT)-like permease